MTRYIPQMVPLITEADIQAVNAYMSSGGWLTEFRQTRLFEQRIAEFTGAKSCSVTPNGTLALFLALSACEVGRGDEVIVPDFTMAASATAVLLAGADVVFCDIEPQTLCLDLEMAARLISSRTKAVMVVSLNGRAPRGLADFAAACRRRGIRVIEDAAQSIGSFQDGRHLGTFGDCGCFSFSSQKLVTTGQGGAVVTSDEGIQERMLAIRDFGRLTGGTDRYLTVGWNLKFTDLQAVIGLEQMRRLPELVERKRNIYRLYRSQLSQINEIELPETDLSSVTPWFIDVLVDPNVKQPLMEHLRQNDVGSRAFYPALHAEPAFSMGGSFPASERTAARGIWLPSSLMLEAGQIEKICRVIRQFFEASGKRI
jgi:perosamine synthetase